MVDDVRTGGLQDRINRGIDDGVRVPVPHCQRGFQIELRGACHPGASGNHRQPAGLAALVIIIVRPRRKGA